MTSNRIAESSIQRGDVDASIESLPPLAFGETTARVDSDVQSFSDRMSRVVTSLQAYEAIGSPKKFRQKSATATINGLRLTAGVCTPVQIEVAENADSTLMIPFSGRCTTLIGSRPMVWAAGENGLFLPSVGRGGFSTTRSVLLIDVQQRRLQDAARAMLGLEAGSFLDFRLYQERQIELSSQEVDFQAAMLHLCGLIDAVNGEAVAASALKIDDQFYRLMALMLHPGLMNKEVIRRVDTDSNALDEVCDSILSRLGAPLGLSDMEQVSGLSRRSLQYAFLRKFNCTPMQWVREQRLLKARELLRSAAEPSVTAIALQCGFINVGAFSGQYLKRFGEYPSATLQSAAKR